MANGNTWVEAEITLLKKLWPRAEVSAGELHAQLPRHTPLSINRKASELRCKRRRTAKQSRYPIIRQLWRAREIEGYARVDLAERMGYHAMMLGRWERGEATPSLRRLHDWADCLGFHIAVRTKESAG